MPDISVAEIPVDEEERPLPPPQAPVRNALLDGPILRTLLWLAWPNVIALSAGTCVVIAETSYIGRLGVESLAAMALVFPCVILTMTMSGGAMGGGVASAIARALGAGDRERASTLAAHALLIGLCFGLTFMLGMLIFGPRLLELLGGRGNVLAQPDVGDADLCPAQPRDRLLHQLKPVARGREGEPVRALVRLGFAAAHPGEHRLRPVTLPRAGQFHLQDLAADAVLKLVPGSLRDHLPVVDHGDPVGQLIGFLEVLGGQQERCPLAPQLADDGPHSLRLRGSRPVVGSSRNGTRGRVSRLEAMSSRRRIRPK